MGRGNDVLIALGVLVAMTTSHASAQTNYALDFDGDDVVEVNDPVITNGPLTVEAWILTRSTVQAGRFISNRNGGGGFEMDVHDPGSGPEIRFSINASREAYAAFGSYMNVWTHVAATWVGPDDQDASLYINGQHVYTGPAFEPMTSPGPLSIGRMGSSEGFFFDGLIDEVRLWETALDETTIADWMDRAVTPDHPNYTDLAAYWRFDEGSGQVAYSEVFSPDVDGRLGQSGVPDAQDPGWVESGATPGREVTIGQIKSFYRER